MSSWLVRGCPMPRMYLIASVACIVPIMPGTMPSMPCAAQDWQELLSTELGNMSRYVLVPGMHVIVCPLKWSTPPMLNGFFIFWQVSLTRYFDVKLSVASIMKLYCERISSAFSLVRKVLWQMTLTKGLSSAMRWRADSVLGVPTVDVVWMICRWRLERLTLSLSTMPIVPMPAAAR